MFRNTVMAAVMTLTAGAVGLTGIDAAQAFPPVPAPLSQPTAAGEQILQLAAVHRKVMRRGHHRWVYKRHYGPRFRHRHGRYIYYYGGWWYPRPWWGLSVGIYPGPCRTVVKYVKHRKVVRRVCY